MIHEPDTRRPVGQIALTTKLAKPTVENSSSKERKRYQ